MADGYGGLPPYGYGSGGAAFMSGMMPGLNRTVDLLAQMPMIKQQAEQMAQQQAMQNMKTLIEILNLPDPMGGAALEQFGPRLGVDAGLIATLKKGKAEQRAEIAGFLQEAGIGTGPGAQMATRILQQNPAKAFELWNKAREDRRERERFRAQGQMMNDEIEIGGREPAPQQPAAPPPPERPYPPAAYGEPSPPPAPPSVAPGAPTGAIAPAEPQPMPTEPALADWQRDPDYQRARSRVESSMRTITNIQTGYKSASRTAESKTEQDRIDANFKQRLEIAKEQLDAAQKDLATYTPEFATHVTRRSGITGKDEIVAVDKKGRVLGTIGNAPLKPQSPLGQTIEDLKSFERTYGVESPEAQRIVKSLEQGQEVKESDKHNLRQEFTKHADRFVIVRDGFRRIGAAQPGVVGDMAIIFGIMKMFDPGSVVRETEYATAENARGVPDTIRNMWNRLMDGDKLTPEQRVSFRQQGAQLYAQQLASHRQLEEQYRGIAIRARIDPRDIIVNFAMESDEAGGTSNPVRLPSALGATPAQKEAARRAAQGVQQSGGAYQKAVDEALDALRSGAAPQRGR